MNARQKIFIDNYLAAYEEYILYSSGKRIEITPFGDGDNMGSVDTLIEDENIVAIASAFPQKGVFYSDIQRRVVMFKSMEDQSEDVTILRGEMEVNLTPVGGTFQVSKTCR